MKKISILKYVGLILLLLTVTFVSMNTMATQSEALSITINLNGRAYFEQTPSGITYGCKGDTENCRVTVNIPFTY